MKKFSLKFMVVFILVLFNSLIYADGVFSRYYNDKFLFSIDVPITKYEQDTPDDKGAVVNLDFIKNSKFIPTKKYYNGKSPKNINPLKYDYNKMLFINGNNIAYNTIGKDFYVVSYIENNKIHYKKVIYNRNENSYAIFETSYLAKDKKFMDKIVTEMANSIKF